MKDKFGLYVQADGDAGDCPHRSGLMLFYFSIMAKTEKLQKIYFEKNADSVFSAIQRVLQPIDRSGIYIRYPAKAYKKDQPEYWHDPKEFSRDQCSRLLLGFAAYGAKKSLWRMLWARRKKCFLLHQNNDLIGPGDWANFIRGLNLWGLYPLLWVLDLKFIGDVFFRQLNKWDYDSLCVPDLYYAKKKFWTPTAWLASKLYKLTDYMKCMAYNHSLAKNGCEEVGLAMKQIGERL